ncbi:hypothetical protein [Streptomyces sp. NPDC051218]|uniref:hypothetical protein n=1 Tax=Streptomyces sp. NPDC051218 TaxID=3365645 RepID=UPI0037A84FCF
MHEPDRLPDGPIKAPSASPLSGEEAFKGIDAAVMDFWRFAMSDLRTNTLRGYLAEFLVARAVGATTNRVEWDAYDVLTPDGIKIEVKAGGYVQAWTQPQASKDPRWAVPQIVPVDPATGKYLPPEARGFQADVYVFAVHSVRTHDEYDALDLRQWTFHVLSRPQLMALPRGSKGHALATLRRVREASVPVGYTTLAEHIRKAAQAGADPSV